MRRERTKPTPTEHPIDQALRQLFPRFRLPPYGSPEWNRGVQEGHAAEEKRRALYLERKKGALP